MRTSAFVAIALVLSACSASNEAPPPSEVVKWTATPGAVRQTADGASVLDVVLRADIDPGWKVYSLTQTGGRLTPMTVKLSPDAPYQIDGIVTGPKPERARDPNFDLETETYSGSPTFHFAVRLPPAVDSSKPVELKVRSQACSDKLCLPARTTTVSVAPKAGET